MSKTAKLSVSLTPELIDIVNAAVETGEYATASEMIRETLRAWKHRRDSFQAVSERVRLLVHIGLTGGPSNFTNIEDIEAEARRQLIEEENDRLRALLDEAEDDEPSEPLDMEEIRATARRKLDEQNLLIERLAAEHAAGPKTDGGLDVARIRALWEEGLASGPSRELDMAEVRAECRARLKARLARTLGEVAEAAA